MNTATRWLSLALLCCAADAAPAQQASPAAKPSNAQSEAGEPRADTSSPNPGPASAPVPAPAPAPAATPAAPTAPAAAPTAAPATPTAPAAGHPAAAARASSAAAGAQKSVPKTDRLDLGTATVTGDREQPKVMYIVPWKRSDIGDLAGKPMNSLVDEILSPVDRDVFKREVVYYRAVQSDSSQNGAPPKPAQQGEK